MAHNPDYAVQDFEEEEYTEEQLAQFSIMMQNAFGQDARAAEYISACMKALRGEAEMPMLEEVPRELPNVYAFGVPVQAFRNYEDATQELRDLYTEAVQYPGALDAVKNYIKDYLPEAVKRGVVKEGATEEEIKEAEKTALDKTEAYVMNPEILEYQGFNWRDAIKIMLDAAMEKAPEKLSEEELKKLEPPSAPWYAKARTPGLYAAAKAITEAFAPMPEERETRLYPMATTEEKAKRMGFPMVTVEPKVRLKADVGEATNKLALIEGKIDAAEGDVDWAIEGVFQTYLPHMSLENRARYFEAGYTEEEARRLGYPAPSGGWKQQAEDELWQKGKEAAKTAGTGFVTLSAPQIGRFLNIVNTYPDVKMGFFDQLDLSRSMPREDKQLNNAVLGYVLGRNSSIRGSWLAEGFNERGLNGVEVLDQAFAGVAAKTVERYHQVEVPTTPAERKLGLERYLMPVWERAGYQEMMLSDVLWNFEKRIEQEFFPEPTYTPARTKFASEEREKPTFQRFPVRLGEEERVQKDLMKGIRAYFPYGAELPEVVRKEKPPAGEKQPEARRKTTYGFPTIRYRKRGY